MAVNYNPQFKSIGENFAEQFYKVYDNNETRQNNLHQFYHPQCFFSFENEQKQGKEAAMEKIKSLPFQQIQHVVTTCDTQPLMDGSILVMVTGQLKCDDDKPLPFADTFVLSPEGAAFFIRHEMFRLSMHNV